MTSITIPEGVTSIGDKAFLWCGDLASITLPNTLKSLGEWLFYQSPKITSIIIPSSVTSIADGVFYWASGLKNIVVEEGNPVYDSRENCNAIIETATNRLVAGCYETVIPESVTSIGSLAFSGDKFTAIEIPNSITSIERWAFAFSYGLTSITIPESVTSIGESAFMGCYDLTSITNLSDVPQAIDESTFDGVNRSCVLHVKKGCKEAYQNADGWKNFQIEELPVTVGPETPAEIEKTKEEIEVLVEKIFETIIEKVEENIQQADLDGDGKFSISDIVKMIKISFQK